jgi:very-short-patch-repair endonuclease
MVKRTVSDFKRHTARRLRTGGTEAETILWRHLAGLM